MESSIISSLVESVGTIVAAGVGAFIAGDYVSKAFKRDISPKFQKYADKDHDVSSIMNKAVESIYIIMSIGDHLLEKHEDDFKSYIKSGVKLNFIVHEAKRYYELEDYINCDVEKRKEFYSQIRKNTLEKLRKLRQGHEKLVEIREFDSILTVSYIGVDIESDSGKWRRSAMIQLMPYQYRVQTKNNPIIRITPKENIVHFETVKTCITDIWKKGETIE